MDSKFVDILQSAITEPGIISRAYSAFHNYSLGNQIAAVLQCVGRSIELGPIATFPGWKDKGRSVRKGEKAIALCMPVTLKGKREAADGTIEEFAFNRFVWRNNWFVLSQTDGADYAAEVRSPAWDADRALTALEIKAVPFTHPDGNCQGYAAGREIAVSPIAEYPHKTRFHELAHVVLGHTLEATMTDSERTPKDTREVEAESVAYILCTLLGLPGLEESRGYVQSWLSGQTISEKSAMRIFGAADKILKAGRHEQMRHGARLS